MAVSEDFAARIAELLEGLGPIRTRRMFGGLGVYSDDLMFGLAFGETLYLKADDETRPAFEAAGSAPFTYAMKDGSSASLRYWSLPDEAADDPEAAARWARLAVEAVLRARKPKKGRRADIGPGPWDEA